MKTIAILLMILVLTACSVNSANDLTTEIEILDLKQIREMASSGKIKRFYDLHGSYMGVSDRSGKYYEFYRADIKTIEEIISSAPNADEIDMFSE